MARISMRLWVGAIFVRRSQHNLANEDQDLLMRWLYSTRLAESRRGQSAKRPQVKE